VRTCYPPPAPGVTERSRFGIVAALGTVQEGACTPPEGPLESEIDESTLRRLAGGDPAALADCFRVHGARVWRLARALLGQAADADDATQEIFLRVREKAAGFGGRGSFSGWLRRLAVNHCLNLLARRRSRQERVEALEPDSLAVPAPVALDTLDSLERALARLPDDQRAALALREIEGLSYREIAGTLAIPIGTVMSRIARARERLLGAPVPVEVPGAPAPGCAAPMRGAAR